MNTPDLLPFILTALILFLMLRALGRTFDALVNVDPLLGTAAWLAAVVWGNVLAIELGMKIGLIWGLS